MKLFLIKIREKVSQTHFSQFVGHKIIHFHKSYRLIIYEKKLTNELNNKKEALIEQEANLNEAPQAQNVCHYRPNRF